MKIEELRIGNTVLDTETSKETTIDLSDLITIAGGSVRFAPIPLTPELLERCGFIVEGDFDNHSVDYHINGCLHLQMSNYEGNECDYVWRDNQKEDGCIGDMKYTKQYSTEVKYLHQLQNLHFALTSTELTTTP